MTDQPASNDLNDYPVGLRLLVGDLRTLVSDLMTRLEAGDLLPEDWQAEMEALLARYHTAAYMTGTGTANLSKADLANLARIVTTQLSFLDNFTLVIQSEAEFQAKWWQRAELYANAIANPYWKGRTRMLPLPAMPGDGSTQCLTSCKCKWDIQVVDEDKDDYDCFWILGPVKTEHCQTCEIRARDWAPLKIRGGKVVLFESVTAKALVTEKYNPYHDPKNGRFTFNARAMDPNSIEPVNTVDSGKVDLIAARMQENGWEGNPILAYETGDRIQAVTGSHRLAAAKAAGIEVPVSLIDTSKFTDEDADTFLDIGRDDDASLSVMKKLYERGLVTKSQLQIMKDEVKNSDWVLRKDNAAYFDKPKKEAKVENQGKRAHPKANSEAKAKYQSFLSDMKAKYKNPYQDMTDAEMEKMDRLEREAYSA